MRRLCIPTDFLLCGPLIVSEGALFLDVGEAMASGFRLWRPSCSCMMAAIRPAVPTGGHGLSFFFLPELPSPTRCHEQHQELGYSNVMELSVWLEALLCTMRSVASPLILNAVGFS